MSFTRVSMFCAALVFAVVAVPGYAWNESGHRIIAAAAAAQMSPELQARVVSLLEAHPRYADDLLAYQPKKLRDLSHPQWLMGQAAAWPDHARSFDNAPRRKRDALVETYHRGNWHYINLPVYLTRADRRLRIKDPTASPNLNAPRDVLSALLAIGRDLQNPDISIQQKGLWLSWALHLIADVHQPLHTSAVFSKKRWPRGDRGGNEVKVAGTEKKGRLDSLHYFWDSAISNRRRPHEVAQLVEVLDAQVLPEVASNELDPTLWIAEGHQLAQTSVYGPLSKQILASPVVNIDTEYTQQTHKAALQRAALAARRTALWLEWALFGEPLVGSE